MEYKKLGDIATFINGYAFKPSDRGEVGLPIIRIQDLTGNGYDLGFYNGEYPKKVEINNGDILISWSASLGVYVWNNGKALLNQHIFKVVFDKVEIDKYYFVFAIQYYLDEMKRKTHGATMKHSVKKDFDCTLIPYPSVEKQREISNILLKVKYIIDTRKKQLEEYDELIKARFVEMFGDPITNPMRWEKALLSKVIDVVGGYAFKSGDFNEDYGVPVLRIGNINSGYFKPVNMVYWNEDEKLEKYAIYPGDLVVSLTGTVGKNDYGNVCIIGDDYNMYYLNQRNAKLSIEGEINKYYLAQLLKYEAIKQKLTGISRGVRQANISNADILNLIIPIPPLAKQNQFADFVKLIYKSKFVEEKNLIIMCKIKRSLYYDQF